MFVITADQKGSRDGADRVPLALASLTDLLGPADGLVLPFERTAGDEIQGVLATPRAALDAALTLLATDHWYVGLGLGEVEQPLGDSARASRGPAFIRARQAIELAKARGVPQPVAIRGADEARAAEAQALLRLLAAVVSRRSPEGREACAVTTRLGSQRRAADHLGISGQALSQRLRAALYQAERDCHPLAARLLAEADAEADDPTGSETP